MGEDKEGTRRSFRFHLRNPQPKIDQDHYETKVQPGGHHKPLRIVANNCIEKCSVEVYNILPS